MESFSSSPQPIDDSDEVSHDQVFSNSSDVKAFENKQSVPDKINDDETQGAPEPCFPKGEICPTDLLPNDEATQWSLANPTGVGNVKDQNFLHPGWHIGINTVGQSLRNANLQVRAEPPNPTTKVGPWQQSTIEPDLQRKPLEIQNEC